MSNYKNQDFVENIGKRIDEIRKSKNLTYERLAERMGLSDTRHIGRVIHAETNFSTSEIERFAYALGVHPTELLNFEFKLNPDYVLPLSKKEASGL